MGEACPRLGAQNHKTTNLSLQLGASCGAGKGRRGDWEFIGGREGLEVKRKRSKSQNSNKGRWDGKA